jgi:DNA helicase-4
MTSNKTVEELERIIAKIKIQTFYKIIGFLLVPLIIGIFVIKKANRNLHYLIYSKEKTIDNVKRDIKKALKEVEDTYEQIKKEDTYLIYSVRENITDSINQYLKDLSFLESRKKQFQDDFNSFVNDSYNHMVSIKEKVWNFNSGFIERRIRDYDYLFKKSAFPLDNDQKTAIITDDKHNLVVAGAGSGKTEVLITRIAYLIERKPDTIKPERILALAYQNKAAREMKERLNERYDVDVTIKTFHSLGNEILKKATKNSKEGVPKLKFSGDNYEKEYNRFIKTLFRKAQEDSELQNDLINYMKLYGDDEVIKKEVDFETKEEYYRYMRNLTYTTLDGTKVKSEAEREIMNFFITRNLNGKKVKILYEQPAEWMKYSDEKGEHIPRPDFFFLDYDIYIEHWALNKGGRVPEWFGGENPTNEYKRGMEAKQKKFQEQDKYVLVETTHGEFEEKNFLQLLEKKILKALEEKYPDKKFTFTALSYDELVRRVWEECRESTKAMPLNISKFIRIAKTYSSTPEDIERRLSLERWSPKQEAFAKITIKLYKRYENELRSANQIDFCDMINLAVKELKEKENLYRNVFDHILIDEYQDISTQRYNLIKELMKKNPDCKLFCVGDDWQSIMGFTGSDLDFFVKFDAYFDHPARTYLTINYRSIKSVVDTGAEIIKHNGDAQLKKETIAHTDKTKPIKVYSSLHQKEYYKQYYSQIAEHCVNNVSEYLKKG